MVNGVFCDLSLDVLFTYHYIAKCCSLFIWLSNLRLLTLMYHSFILHTLRKTKNSDYQKNDVFDVCVLILNVFVLKAYNSTWRRYIDRCNILTNKYVSSININSSICKNRSLISMQVYMSELNCVTTFFYQCLQY